MKDFSINLWCSSPIYQIMDWSSYRWCREISGNAGCVCWIWSVSKRHWLQLIIPGHPYQHSVQFPFGVNKERREWRWEPFVAAIPWRDRLHGRWLCHCALEISFNNKHHNPSVQETRAFQLQVLLEMPLGLQEEELIGEFQWPWWVIRLYTQEKSQINLVEKESGVFLFSIWICKFILSAWTLKIKWMF